MKTPLEPIAKELAAVLGPNSCDRQPIFVSRTEDRAAETETPDPETASGETVLGMIEAALDRLKLGTFGLCTHCGEEISLSRLDHDPSVPHCQVCEDDARTPH